MLNLGKQTQTNFGGMKLLTLLSVFSDDQPDTTPNYTDWIKPKKKKPNKWKLKRSI